MKECSRVISIERRIAPATRSVVRLECIVIATVAAVVVFTPFYMAAGIAVAVGDCSSSEGAKGGQRIPEAVRMTAIPAATLVIPAVTAMARLPGPAFTARFDLDDISLGGINGRLAYGADR